jgi:hypothetical protein
VFFARVGRAKNTINVNSIAPFQPRDMRLKWRKKVPAHRAGHLLRIRRIHVPLVSK